MKTSVSHNTAREFTKSCIMEALLQLMHTKDYNDISITDITARAGVSRMAYYRNYRSKDLYSYGLHVQHYKRICR